jgi:hypothetical protein
MPVYAFSRCRSVDISSALPKIIPAGQSSLIALGKRQRACAWPVAADVFDIGTRQVAVSLSQEPRTFSEPVIGAAEAGPDAIVKRSASRIVLILVTVGQDGLDRSQVMRFRDIFSLAIDSEWVAVAAEET